LNLKSYPNVPTRPLPVRLVTIAMKALINPGNDRRLLDPLIFCVRKAIFEEFDSIGDPKILLYLVTTKFFRRPNESDRQLFDQCPLKAFLHHVFTPSEVQTYMEKYPKLKDTKYTLEGRIDSFAKTDDSLTNSLTDGDSPPRGSFSDMVVALLGPESGFSDDARRHFCKKIISSVKDKMFQNCQDEFVRRTLVNRAVHAPEQAHNVFITAGRYENYMYLRDR